MSKATKRQEAFQAINREVQSISGGAANLMDLGDTPELMNNLDTMEDMSRDEWPEFAEDAANDILAEAGFPCEV